MRGIIVKALAGFYYVEADKPADQRRGSDEDTSPEIFQCRARGLFKKEGLSPLVGDEVLIELTDDVEVEGVVTEIMPRRNEFIRPPIANIDLYVATVSVKDPKTNFEVLDRFLATACSQNVDILICIGKTDLGSPEEIEAVYRGLYPLLTVSAVTEKGIDELQEALTGKKAAFAGPSGVGKSTLINLLVGSRYAETGKVSKKTRRGKHTTRHIEILDTDFGARLFDTPGYTAFQGAVEDEAEIGKLFPEFAAYAPGCRFHNCRHSDEPGCAVRKAVEEKKINESRYNSYVKMLREAQSLSSWEKKN